MPLLSPISLVGVFIYKKPFTFQSIVPRELAKAHFESLKWAASFGNETRKEAVLSKVTNNVVFKALLTASLSYSCRARKRPAQDMLFLLLEYQRLL